MEQYDRKVGLEHKVQGMRHDKGKEQLKTRSEILSYPVLGQKSLTLIQHGERSDQEIIDVDDIIEKFNPLANAVIDGKPEMQSLVSDLKKYGNIKSAVHALTSDLDSLKNEAAYLGSQNQDLKQENLRMFSSSINICRTVDFFQGAVFSLRNEIMNLVLIYLYVTRYLIERPFHGGQKLQSADQFSNEFEALSTGCILSNAYPVSSSSSLFAVSNGCCSSSCPPPSLFLLINPPGSSNRFVLTA